MKPTPTSTLLTQLSLALGLTLSLALSSCSDSPEVSKYERAAPSPAPVIGQYKQPATQNPTKDKLSAILALPDKTKADLLEGMQGTLFSDVDRFGELAEEGEHHQALSLLSSIIKRSSDTVEIANSLSPLYPGKLKRVVACQELHEQRTGLASTYIEKIKSR